MQKSKWVVPFILLASLVAACSDDNSDEQSESQTTEQTEGAGESSEQANEEASENTNVLEEGQYEDQLDLSVGDTGTVETLLGTSEFKVNGVKRLDEVDGELSDLDYFLLVSLTVKNIGEDDIDARETVGILEATDFLEGTGFSDEAPYSESIEAIEGTLAPEEEITGDILFVAHEADEYFIRVREGLIGSGAAKNQILYTFQASEIEGP
ncbi:DUF4352 domain-containing protein [Alkalicoccobacillus gibsonii]|uniref:DUF4352 domain-containing protein n=1 Tax=Alkalicoccobacillus gibsonii TaxID=79881 RepID=UPI001932F3DF|nr:DUF4352 domain-containing protein [Alkalicoccobacillus gibsonii]MBM0066645.1 DUF4352 domain-containing protein [Alkalicoccobacillus gibsonii]